MRGSAAGQKRIENLLNCPPEPRCVARGRSPPAERTPFPERFRGREKLEAQGWLYCVVCNCAVLR